MPGPTQCFFGNTTLSQGFDFTFGPGVQPSICSVYTVPHVNSLPQVATLTLETVGEPPLVFHDCALEEPRLDVGSGGQRWVLPIKDRRWKWQADWGPVYGHFNIPKPDATYIREKTPQELASMLLTEMGETGFNVSRLPNSPRPEIHWDGANSTTELDQLCNSLGCIVVLNPVTNKVEIWPVGQGAALPDGPTQGAAYAPILPIKPSKITVEAGPTLFQATFKTEAVGLDTDGKWKPIDSLSYKPAVGWGKAAIHAGFPEIIGAYLKGSQLLPTVDLGKGTVFRCYRISGLASGGLQADGTTKSNWQPELMQTPALYPLSRKDLRFYDFLVDEEISLSDGGYRSLPTHITGRWYEADQGYLESLLETIAGGELLKTYTKSYRFDTEQTIIEFGEPLYLMKEGNAIPAEIRIETAFNAGRNGVFDRWKKDYDLNPGWTTPTRLVQRHDIYARVKMKYSKDNTYTIEDSATDTLSQLSHWGDAALAEYGAQQGGTVRYAKLMPLSVDGLTQQITWSGGGGRPPSTTVSQGQRHNRFVAPLSEQRAKLVARKTEKAIAKTDVSLSSFSNFRQATV